MNERKGIITFGGDPVTLIGEETKVGSKAPEFKALKNDLSEFSLDEVKGKVVIISSVPSIDTPLRVTAKTHYRMKAQPGWARIEDHMLVMEFDEPQRAAAPGQALVLYDDDTVVGGGTIVSA